MKPTLDELRKYREQAISKFGLHDAIAYVNVSHTYLSIARFSDGCTIQGLYFVYNEADDSLIREDVVKWILQQRKQEATSEEQ